MTLIILLSAILVLVTVYLHQVTFFSLTTYTPRYVRNPHLRVYILVLGIFLVHMLEIAVYAGAYYIASSVMNLGILVGESAKGVLGHFYYSVVIYTSLGFGDVLPIGHLRFMTATEAMNGYYLSLGLLLSRMRGWVVTGASLAITEMAKKTRRLKTERHDLVQVNRLVLSVSHRHIYCS